MEMEIKLRFSFIFSVNPVVRSQENGGWQGRGGTYRAVVEVEKRGAEELRPLLGDLRHPRPVVRRRRVRERRHLGGADAILRRGGDRGRGEAGMRPAGGEGGLEEPPGGGEALHVWLWFSLCLTSGARLWTG